MKKGVGPQQAFEIAVRKIGQVDVLKREFQKSAGCDEARKRKWKLFWMGLGALCYAGPMVLSAPHMYRELNVIERWITLTAFAITIMSLFSGLVTYRFLPVILDRKERTRAQMAALLLTSAWLVAFGLIILPHLEFTIDWLFTATLWAVCPLAIFAGFVVGLNEAARRRGTDAGS